MKKIILIVSERQDAVTDEIYKWLLKLDENCIIKRINHEDEIFNISIQLPSNEIVLTLEGEILPINKIHKIWYRRGYLNYLFNKKLLPYKEYLTHEYLKFHDGLWSIIKDKSISSFLNNKVNKIEMLVSANQVGLNIPNTIYTGCKNELMQFYKANNKTIITKAISNAAFFNEKDKLTYGEGTKIVKQSDIDKTPDNFFISVFQEKIEKLFEIRTLYYKEKMFSMAIISQQNEKTKIDYRNYDEDNPNRNLPYSLPFEIKNKIITLMKHLKLDTGSLDFIITPKNQCVFLEVNPFGQYLPVDYLYGSEISKLIASDILQ